MEMTVSQMTVDELRTLIADVVEEKLSELIAEDSDLDINDELRARLVAQMLRVREGERGVPMAKVMQDLGRS